MPRMLGGNSSLGQELNKMNSSTDWVKSRITPEPKVGIIKKVVERNGCPQYYVILTLTDKTTGKTFDSKPILLIDHPSFIASTFGAPKDLEGKYYAEITSTGPSSGRGTARIIRAITDETDKACRWNELDQQGAAFAAPGSGF